MLRFGGENFGVIENAYLGILALGLATQSQSNDRQGCETETLVPSILHSTPPLRDHASRWEAAKPRSIQTLVKHLRDVGSRRFRTLLDCASLCGEVDSGQADTPS